MASWFPFWSTLSAAGFYYLGYATNEVSKHDLAHAKYLTNLPVYTIPELILHFERHPTGFTTEPPEPIQACIVGWTAQCGDLLKYTTRDPPPAEEPKKLRPDDKPLPHHRPHQPPPITTPKPHGLARLIELEIFESIWPTQRPRRGKTTFEGLNDNFQPLNPNTQTSSNPITDNSPPPTQVASKLPGHGLQVVYPYRIHRDFVEVGSMWLNHDIKLVDKSEMAYFDPATHKYYPPHNRAYQYDAKQQRHIVPTFPQYSLSLPGTILPNDLFELVHFEEQFGPEGPLDLELICHTDNLKVDIGKPILVGTREEEIEVPLGIQVTVMAEFFQKQDLSLLEPTNDLDETKYIDNSPFPPPSVKNPPQTIKNDTRSVLRPTAPLPNAKINPNPIELRPMVCKDEINGDRIYDVVISPDGRNEIISTLQNEPKKIQIMSKISYTASALCTGYASFHLIKAGSIWAFSNMFGGDGKKSV